MSKGQKHGDVSGDLWTKEVGEVPREQGHSEELVSCFTRDV